MFVGINLAVAPYSAALVEKGSVIAEFSVADGFYFSEHLILEIERLCAGTGRELRSLAGVAVCTGPGSYTGLRIGVTVAKMMGLSYAVPVYGVSAYEAYLYPLRFMDGVYQVVFGARKQEYNTALFAVKKGAISALTDELTLSEEALKRHLKQFREPITLVGTVEQTFVDGINPLLYRAETDLRASAVAAAGEARFLAGGLPGKGELQPRYSYEPYITAKKTAKNK